MPAGAWLILADDQGVAEQLAQQLLRQGSRSLLATPGRAFRRLDDTHYEVAANEPASYEQLIEAALQIDNRLAGIIHLWSYAAQPRMLPSLSEFDRSVAAPVEQCMHLVQALARRQDVLRRSTNFSFVLGTSAAQSTGDEPDLNWQASPLLGLTLVLPRELRGIWRRSVDLDPRNTAELAAEQLWTELRSGDAVAEVAYRGRQRLGRSIERTLAAPGTAPWRRGGVYILTGGLGGIGRCLAQRLARDFGAHLILTGRTEVPTTPCERTEFLAQLQSIGAASVEYFAGDSADAAHIAQLMQHVAARHGHLDGVLHLAGIVDTDRLALRTKTPESLRAVLGPKLSGSWLLAEAARELGCQTIVFFSSIASLSGPLGAAESDYAAACRFQNTFAEHLVRSGMAGARSVLLSEWGSVGILAHTGVGPIVRQLGLLPMSEEFALAKFERSLTTPIASSILIRPTATDFDPPALLADVTPEEHKLASQASAPESESADRALLPAAIAPRVQQWSAEMCADLASYEGFDTMLDLLSGVSVAATMASAGLFLKPGERHTEAEIAARLGVVPSYERLFQRLIKLLAESKRIVRDGEHWVSLLAFAPQVSELLWSEASRRFADSQAIFDLLRRGGESLGEVMAGRRDPVEVLFPAGAMNDAEVIYRETPLSRFYNRVAAEIVADRVRRLATSSPAAIVEVGAGTGGTTSRILPLLPADRCSYLFTDISTGFLNKAESQFEAYPFVRYRTLDIERAPLDQRLEESSYDVVVAANVLHATRRLDETIAHVRRLLRPGGLLILLETTRPAWWVDLTFGLTDGWWRFEDTELRAEQPLLTVPQWDALLRRHAFARVEPVMAEQYGLPNAAQHLIVAEADDSRVTTPARETTKPAAVRARGPQTPVAASAPRDADDQRATIERYLADVFSRMLRLPLDELDPQANFMDLGFDSIVAIQIRNELANQLGVDLGATLLFRYPSIQELADYLTRHDEYGPRLATLSPPAAAPPHAEPPQPPATSPPAVAEPAPVAADEPASESPVATPRETVEPAATTSSPAAPSASNTADVSATDIAVVSISCRLPGAATPEEFWQGLRRGAEHLREIPRERWAWWGLEKGESSENREQVRRLGSFLDNLADFDPYFFQVSPHEARLMDPQQRLMLELCWEAFERAGYRPGDERVARCGVYLGVACYDYSVLLGVALCDSVPHALSGGAIPLVASRISYALDLHGPSLTLNTACSSSLVAVEMACRSLADGAIDAALTGGINVMLHPQASGAVSEFELLASDGRCKAFDNRADGFLRGEGGAVVLLKRLQDAIRDGDQIVAVIKAASANNDGHSKLGLSAPSPRAQEEVIGDAWRASQLDPSTLGYWEAHGTGTALGDPIEIDGASQALRRWTQQRAYCAIGSVKSNLGHLEAAAGVVGLIKAILAVSRQEIPPTLHVSQPNRQINFEDSPFYINDRLRPWRTEGPRRAAVSSFGLGGTNVHVVLEQAPAIATPPSTIAQRPAHLLVISARSEAALSKLVAAYHARLASSSDWNLADVCFTAACGRTHYDHRVAVVAHDADQLLDRLQLVKLSGAPQGLASSHIYAGGQVGEPTDESQNIVARLNRLSRPAVALLATWCRGGVPAGAVADRLTAARAQDDSIADGSELSLPTWTDLCSILAWLYAQGTRVDWNALYRGLETRRVLLPTYPFERQRCWVDLPNSNAPMVRTGEDSPAAFAPHAATSMATGAHTSQVALPQRSGIAAIYWPTWVARRALPPASLQPVEHDLASTTCLVFTEGTLLGRQIIDSLRESGRQVIEVRRGREYAKASDRLFEIDPDHAADYLQVLQHTTGSQLEVIHLWSGEREQAAAASLADLDAHLAAGARSLYHLARAWSKLTGRTSFTLRAVTRGATNATSSTTELLPERAAAIGMLTSLGQEDPAIITQSIDLSAVGLDAEVIAQELASELLRAPLERELVLTASGWQIPQMEPVDLVAADRRRVTLRNGGVYLVTGGLGGLGRELCRWLAERHSARLVITGRTPLPAEAEWSAWLDAHANVDPTSERIRAIKALRASGASVTYVAVDVTDLQAMSELVREIRREHGQLHGVFHTAGVLHDGLLARKKRQLVDEVMRPKIVGAWVLDHVTRGEGLDLLVLFSSVATWSGSPGQCEYVAANRYLDIFAAWRQAQGRPTLAIDWGLWGETGMGAHLTERTRDADVLRPMATADALRQMERALALDTPQLIIAGFGSNWERPIPAASPTAASEPKFESTSPTFETVPTREEILALLLGTLSRLLEIPPERLSPATGFADQGMDSILMIRFSRELEAALRRSVGFELLQRHDTPQALAAYLADEMAGTASLAPSVN